MCVSSRACKGRPRAHNALPPWGAGMAAIQLPKPQALAPPTRCLPWWLLPFREPSRFGLLAFRRLKKLNRRLMGRTGGPDMPYACFEYVAP